ncbi:uncharacterized protein LOC135828505 isoform X1 [Sycon ciliatum]|uniref:uncharacterized protein LOC135828505 isoform X1 n=1 Tax=Sycon ciliatum TaxID=27933 RepID=UPI0031F5F074
MYSMGSCSYVFMLLVGGFAFQVCESNIIHGGSFEERSSRWLSRLRSNMWNFDPAPDGVISITGEHANSGLKSLKFFMGPKSGRPDPNLALVASQFLYLPDTCANDSTGHSLTFQFHVRKPVSVPALARLDIRYTDRSFMFVKTPLVDLGDGESFTRVCRTIPDYGRIESILVSLSAEPLRPGQEIYFDDVALDFGDEARLVGDDHQPCPAYKQSFPVRRRVEPGFIVPVPVVVPVRAAAAGARITIATQLTVDRLDNLERMAEQWQGPISAAVMVWAGRNGQPEARRQIAEVEEFISSRATLLRFVTVHLVHEDIMNGEDHFFYPVNYLRAVSLEAVHTQYVYYLDVDIVPAFDEATTARLVAESKGQVEADNVAQKWAFITPLLNLKSATSMPSSKTEAVKWIGDGQLEVFAVVSHSIVQYGKWMQSSTSFLTDYRENVEPYFIIDTSYAPKMMEMFSGYGRDKCAYSREAHGMGIQFVTMHSTYAINWKQTSRQRSIASFPPPDGNLVQLRVYLNSLYHEKEIEVMHGGKRYPPLCPAEEDPASTDHHVSDVNNAQEEEDQSVDSLPEPSYGVRCAEWLTTEHVNMEEPPHPPSRPYHRDDTIIEGILMDFNTTVLVKMGSNLNVHRQMLVMMHMGSVMLVDNVRGGKVSVEAQDTLQFIVRGGLDLQEVMQQIEQHSPGKMLVWLDSDLDAERMKSLLSGVPSSAVIVLAGTPEQRNDQIRMVCRHKAKWTAHARGSVAVLAGGAGFHVAEKPYLPTLPGVALDAQPPSCTGQDLSLDVILFTRNRPVQLLSFVESLAMTLRGVTRVVVVLRSDDELFDKGYAIVEQQARHLGVQLKILNQNDEHFGNLLLQHFTSDASRYTLFAVDEIVWLRPLDLSTVLCYLEKSNGVFGSAQLRLGNANFRARYSRVQAQSWQLPSNSEFLALYPYQLPYDWGYVLNVDGTLMKTSDVVTDLQDLLSTIPNPSRLENVWIVHRLPKRCRQWHLTFAHTYLVNNVLEDGRVLAQIEPAEKSKTLARKLVEGNQKVDVARFQADNADGVASTHISAEVHYIQLKGSPKEEL